MPRSVSAGKSTSCNPVISAPYLFHLKLKGSLKKEERERDRERERERERKKGGGGGKGGGRGGKKEKQS